MLSDDEHQLYQRMAELLDEEDGFIDLPGMSHRIELLYLCNSNFKCHLFVSLFHLPIFPIAS